MSWKQILRRRLVALRQRHLGRQWARPPGGQHDRRRILVVGVYLSERANQVEHLVERFADSRLHEVTQAWANLGRGVPPPAVAPHTRLQLQDPRPKFLILNDLLAGFDLSQFDFVICTDDDYTVPRNFLDAYIGWVERCGFAVAQPARTAYSYTDHRFVRRRVGLKARETRFVEIGPVFSFDRRAAQLLLPFDPASPMGWGYDYVWPAVLREHGLRMGIVDAAPADHSYRPQGVAYDRNEHLALMRSFLGSRPHLDKAEAMRILRRYYR